MSRAKGITALMFLVLSPIHFKLYPTMRNRPRVTEDDIGADVRARYSNTDGHKKSQEDDFASDSHGANVSFARNETALDSEAEAQESGGNPRYGRCPKCSPQVARQIEDLLTKVLKVAKAKDSPHVSNIKMFNKFDTFPLDDKKFNEAADAYNDIPDSQKVFVTEYTTKQTDGTFYDEVGTKDDKFMEFCEDNIKHQVAVKKICQELQKSIKKKDLNKFKNTYYSLVVSWSCECYNWRCWSDTSSKVMKCRRLQAQDQFQCSAVKGQCRIEEVEDDKSLAYSSKGATAIVMFICALTRLVHSR